MENVMIEFSKFYEELDVFVSDYPILSGFSFSLLLILIGFGERSLDKVCWGKRSLEKEALIFPLIWLYGGGFFIVVLIRFLTGWTFG
jgi:hypothetical protein